MFRELLNATSLFDLPLLAMCLFVAMFLGVLVHVAQRRRRPQFDHMSTLPLDADTGDRRTER